MHLIEIIKAALEAACFKHVGETDDAIYFELGDEQYEIQVNQIY